MNRRTIPRILTTVAIVTMVVSAIGFIAGVLLNIYVLDKYADYDAYGEAPISGANSKVDLKAGDMTVYLHTVQIDGAGSGIAIPGLHFRIRVPGGAEATMNENYGRWTTGDNDTHVRIGDLHVPADGNYEIKVDGDVKAYQKPSLAFGERTGLTILPVLFAVSFGLAVVVLIVARVWAARVRRAPVSSESAASVPSAPPLPPVPSPTPAQAAPTVPNVTPAQAAPTVPNVPTQQAAPTVKAAPVAQAAPTGRAAPTVPNLPTQQAESATSSDEGSRQLDTLKSLRDSGVLTEEEYEAEKKRVLEGR
jgi:hypothetical protein